MPPAATLAAHPAFRQGRGAEVFLSPTDGRARKPRDLGDRLQTAPSCRADLAGCEPPPPALIELRADGRPSLPNRLRVDHADPHTPAAPSKESRRHESHHHMAPGAFRFTCCDGWPNYAVQTRSTATANTYPTPRSVWITRGALGSRS